MRSWVWRVGLSMGLCAAFAAALRPEDQARPATPQLRVRGASVTPAKSPLAVGSPKIEVLSEGDAARILGPLPQFTPESEAAPSLPPSSVPPPRAGATILDTFPPAEPVPPPFLERAVLPLRMTRRLPEGGAATTSHLTIVFSQPMVPLASVGRVDSAAIPARLTPEVEGEWIWTAPDTLSFEPRGGFAPGRSWSVEVLAGTRSAVGGRLAQAESWKFTTPEVRVVKAVSDRGDTAVPLAREPVFAVVVDQALSPERLLARLRLEVAGRSVGFTPLSPEQARRCAIGSATWGEKDGHWLAFRPEGPLPFASSVTLRFARSAPGANPRRKSDDQTWTFRTAPLFRVTVPPCGKRRECAAGEGWAFEFSGKLDRESLRPQEVTVDPVVPDLEVSADWRGLTIHGSFRARSVYTLTLPESLHDVDGQTLSGSRVYTVRVTDAAPSLLAPSPFVVLDPSLQGVLPVYSINRDALEWSVRAVTPEDWPIYWEGMTNLSDHKPPRPIPGRLLHQAKLPLSSSRNEWSETRLDLRPWLTDGVGQLLVTLNSLPPRTRRKCGCPERSRFMPAAEFHVWVQVTWMSIDAWVDGEKLVASVTSIEDGRPLADARVSLVPGGVSATTDASGLATLPLTNGGSRLLVARRGQDWTVMPDASGEWDRDYMDFRRTGRWCGPQTPIPSSDAAAGDTANHDDSPWRIQESLPELLWHVFDPQGLYRPGQDVRLKGWIRRADPGPNGDIAPLGAMASAIRYTLQDASDNVVLSGETELNRFGGFSIDFTLPAAMPPGFAELTLDVGAKGADGGRHTSMLRIAEFRRPSYEVEITTADGPHWAGQGVRFETRASYFNGGPLAHAPTTWSVSTHPTNFTPPMRNDFNFGRAWRRCEEHADHAANATHQAQTDAEGKDAVDIDASWSAVPTPLALNASVRFSDADRQARSRDTSVLVHPASVYVGLRGRAPAEKNLEVETIVTDLDGGAVAGQAVEMQIERIEREQDETGEGRSNECAGDRMRFVDSGRCTVVSTAEPVSCSFALPTTGEYRVTARVTDSLGRPNQTELRVTSRALDGEGEPDEEETGQEALEVKLQADKTKYRPGDTAEIRIEVPFAPAEGILTLRRSGIVRTERIRMESREEILRILIEDAWVPNVELALDLSGIGPARIRQMTAEGSPQGTRRGSHSVLAHAHGSVPLRVTADRRRLTVDVQPRQQQLRPRGETVIDIEVRDVDGRAVPDAEIAVAVVDDAILSLTNYSLRDPLDSIQLARQPFVGRYGMRRQRLFPTDQPVDVDSLRAMGYCYAWGCILTGGVVGGVPGGVEGGVPGGQAEALRHDFRPLALFEPGAVTGVDGRVSVRLTLPDSLTRYRILAVATDGGRRFGIGSASLVADQPLLLRPSPPRFLNRGDQAEVTIVAQNRTGRATPVEVAVRANGVDLVGDRAFRLTLPARDRVELRVKAAARREGMVRFHAALRSATEKDAVEFAFPVYPPLTTEAFAAYGNIDEGVVVQPIERPPSALLDQSGLDIAFSSTALAELADAVLYLVRYRYECAEQISSRLLAVSLLTPFLSAFGAPGLPEPAALRTLAEKDIARLAELQSEDGSFSWWRRGGVDSAIVSIHAAQALARARLAGFSVPPRVIERSAAHLRSIEKRIERGVDPAGRRSLLAYALAVRRSLGDADIDRARALMREAGGELPLDAAGWLLSVLAREPRGRAERAKLLRMIDNRAGETATTAEIAASYRDDDHVTLRSDQRTDAVVLSGLLDVAPENPLVLKLVRGLLGHRIAGRWRTTHENAFVLQALAGYFAAQETTLPAFVARAWIGPEQVAQAEFQGRQTTRSLTTVPLAALGGPERSQDLVVAKQGAGRLYYRIGLRYAVEPSTVEPISRGFAVDRGFSAIDRPGDVVRDSAGVWHVRAGARVRVRVTMRIAGRRHHVALVNPLPAGLEAENSVGFGYWGAFFDHETRRDDRFEAFAARLEGGEYRYDAIAVATTPGSFLAPPARAEEMYAPESFGRSCADRVMVETDGGIVDTGGIASP